MRAPPFVAHPVAARVDDDAHQPCSKVARVALETVNRLPGGQHGLLTGILGVLGGASRMVQRHVERQTPEGVHQQVESARLARLSALDERLGIHGMECIIVARRARLFSLDAR
jgi:hypothetical protein